MMKLATAAGLPSQPLLPYALPLEGPDTHMGRCSCSSTPTAVGRLHLAAEA
jgi:hypothetical protein